MFIHCYIRPSTSKVENIDTYHTIPIRIMNRFGFIVSVLLASTILNVGSQAKEAYFDLIPDPHHPQLVTVSDGQYQIVGNKYLEFSGILTVHEELDDGTNVSISHFLFLFFRFSNLNLNLPLFRLTDKNQCVTRFSICSYD